MRVRLFAVLCCSAVLAAPATFAAPADALSPSRVAAPPVIDGILDDAAWAGAAKVAGFKTWTPDIGLEMKEQTEVLLAYDAENIYFGFRCFDGEPARIKTSVDARDRIRADDWIAINLDSFNDQQAMYTFYVNALGIQMDARFAANKEDYGWDAVWFSAGRIDDRGYTVEVRLPFKSIHYGGGDPVRMGVVFERHVSRLSEAGTWPPFKPEMGANFIIQTAPLEFRDIRHYRLVELLPAVTYTHQDALGDDGRLRRLRSQGELSLTGKYGITPRLTLDAAVNPDFSQVEADAGQIDVNLRYNLFYAEKRPFFLEGGEIFNLGGPTGQDGLLAAVHTRTIGDPIAGVKLSGKLGPSDTMAALLTMDRMPGSPSGQPDGDRRAEVGVLRYKRSLRQDGYLGGFFTSRTLAGGRNIVGGADGAVRIDQASSFGFHALVSDTAAPAGAGGVAGATAPTGHAVGLSYARDTRNFSATAMAVDIAPDFQTAVGYIGRPGITRFGVSVGPKLYPTWKRWLRRVDPALDAEQTRDKIDDLWESSTTASLRFVMVRSSSVSVNYRYSSEVFGGREFGTSGFGASASSQIRSQLNLRASFALRDAIYYSGDPFGGWSRSATFGAIWLPSDNLHSELTLTYADFARKRGGGRLYDYSIVRSRNTYQVNRYLFFRGIVEYNSFRGQLTTDLLASFTYVPGTVIHLGYGSLYERMSWRDGIYTRGESFLESRRGFFFKASYLWRN